MNESDVNDPDLNQTPPPPPPHMTAGPAHPGAPATPVVQAVNRRSPFGRLVLGFIVALSILSIVFGLGIVAGVGIVGMTALFIGGSSFDQFVMPYTYRDGSSQKVVILPVDGVIDNWQSSFVKMCVDEILTDPAIRAVVLRVDSPGGAITPSDQIWYQVERLRSAGIPVVASFGSIAASGGYYVSCGCDHIIAEETCITGSIGVIAQVFTLEELMDKVGIEPVTLVATKSPEKMVANDIFRSWDDRDREQIMEMLDSAYALFARRVRDGRAATITSSARFPGITNGSIFTAEEALASGLVDSIGYLDDALAKAESLAGLVTGSATIQEYMERPMLLGGLPLVQSRRPQVPENLDAERIRSLVNDLGTVRLMYLMN